MNGEVVVDHDLKVWIKALHQTSSYEGLMEGFPTKSLNQNVIKRSIKIAESMFGFKAVHVIPPVTKDSHPAFAGAPVRNEPLEVLPDIVCMAKLGCFDVFKDKTCEQSGMILIWFQDDFAFPIQEDILKLISLVPYREACEEWDF